MRRRIIGAPIERTRCKRCSRLFSYPRKTKPRLYCAPCVEKNVKDSNAVSNRFQSEQRIKARETARLCHAGQ